MRIGVNVTTKKVGPIKCRLTDVVLIIQVDGNYGSFGGSDFNSVLYTFSQPPIGNLIKHLILSRQDE
jgi:hypothetical protein